MHFDRADISAQTLDSVRRGDFAFLEALEGLYLMIGEEEKKIRKDPVGAGTDIIRKVFGAL